MARREFLPFSPPCIGDEEIAEVVDTLRTDWITTGPKAKQFERDFAAYLGAPGALALNSCTAGLHTSLITLGIGAGDEVITTALTFAATVNVIEHTGATPVLVDVEPDILTIDPAQVAAAITPRTRAIIPVHYAGHPADMDPINAAAQAHGIAVIEDAAHALPSQYKGAKIGAGANPTSFSFYATKNLTTAEGGMLTGDPDFLDRARVVGLHGMSRDAWKRNAKGGSWFYEVVMPGYKYNMTDIQAALGLQQLKRLDAFQARRVQIHERYNAAFAGCDALQLPTIRPWAEPSRHLYVLRLQPGALRIGRDQFIEEMGARNIGCSVHFIPIHIHPYYRDKYGYAPEAYPVTYENYLREVSIPLNPRMTDDDVADVIEAVLEVVEAFRM
jgi:dTDP-4-amino-4,6-dideoxygalactose transaminase